MKLTYGTIIHCSHKYHGNAKIQVIAGDDENYPILLVDIENSRRIDELERFDYIIEYLGELAYTISTVWVPKEGVKTSAVRQNSEGTQDGTLEYLV